MNWIDTLFHRWGRPRRAAKPQAKFRPHVEMLETREVPAFLNFLQGFAFIDANANGLFDTGESPKVGAQIRLIGPDCPDRIAITDSNGYYRFSDLKAGGIYTLEELTPPQYTAESVQAIPLLSQATVLGANSVRVTLRDTGDGSLTWTRTADSGASPTAYNLEGGPLNGTTNQLLPSNSHQYQGFLSLDGTPITTPFQTYCVDLFHGNPRSFGVVLSSNPYLPEGSHITPTTAENVGRIAYLYNMYGRSEFSAVAGANEAGLGLAFYELLYDSATDLYGGNFQVRMSSTDPAVIAAQNYLNESAGKNQSAAFLNVTGGPDPSAGPYSNSQSMLGTELFNFANRTITSPPPPPGITLVKTADKADYAPGEAVRYTYVVTNTSAVALTNLKITDDNATPANPADDFVVASNVGLAAGASATYTVTVTPPFNSSLSTSVDPGYPFASNNPLTNIDFNESEVLAAARMDPASGTFQVYYSDEHALSLGVRQVNVKTAGGTTTTNYAVAPFTTNPGVALNPATGAPGSAGSDLSGRPIAPSLYITDITNDPNSRAGDWQYGGSAISPSAVFGTWKSVVRNVDATRSPALVSVAVDADPAKNGWNLGAGSDAPPAGTPNQGFGTEARWSLDELGKQGWLVPGHNYRFYVMVHDGDQNKLGGDVGQAAFNVYYPGPSTLTNVAVVTATAGNVSVSARATATIHIQPGSNAGGAAKFFVVEKDKQFGYTAAGTATTSGKLGSGNGDSRGIASNRAGDTYWVIDADKTVYVYDAAGKSLGSWKPGGLDTPEDITTDGTTIWIVDAKKDKVFAYAGAASLRSGSMNATSSFALAAGDTNAMGVVTDGTSLWTVDDGSKLDAVYKYSLSGAPLGSWTIDAADSKPRGLTIDPNNVGDIWIVDDEANAVFRYAGATARTSGNQAAADRFLLASGNSSPQGIADPPPPPIALAVSGSDVRQTRMDVAFAPVADLIATAPSQSAGPVITRSSVAIQDRGQKPAVNASPQPISVSIPVGSGVRSAAIDLGLQLNDNITP